MTNDLKQKTRLSSWRSGWFWVAQLFSAYQAGIFLFLVLSSTVSEATTAGKIGFYGITVLSVAATSLFIRKKDVPPDRRWQIASLLSIAGTLLSAAALGEEGMKTIFNSYIGIPISYEILVTPFIDGGNDIELFTAIGIIAVTFIVWLLLVIKARVLPTAALRMLGIFFIISVLSSIAGCVALSQFHD